MFLVVSSVLSRQLSPLYLFAILIVEGIIGLIVGEFTRGPWEGRIRKGEMLIEEMNERLFESISSMHTNNEHYGAFSAAINTGGINS
jgi:hypothetical protein